MCTDYRRTKGYAAMRDEFSHIRLPVRVPTSDAAPNLEPQDEIRPTNQAVVFRPYEDGIELVRMRWGLMPFFYKEPIEAWKADVQRQGGDGQDTRVVSTAVQTASLSDRGIRLSRVEGGGQNQAQILHRAV